MNYLRKAVRTVRQESPILFTIALIHLLGALFCWMAFFIDDRTLYGINVWIKPLKFCISGAIYIFTVGFLITLYPFSRRKKNIINNIISWSLLLEVGIIVYQASRGVPSHYNQSTLFDGLLFAAMGLLIGINVLIMILFVVETVRLKLKTTKAIQFAIFMGWVIIVTGSWIGSQMVSQMSHTVGIADGGAGLPFVNWSTIAGDLRIAHFFGLHGLQIIPLFAFFLSLQWKASVRKHIIAVTIFAFLYAAWIGYMYYQASQGMPMIKL
ncbi:hypothetical protein [Nonlabens marinus]|uniref:Uncharacterized protein n=1 Tax=Nonlabens marinus S1-08 TaxID=1454201 RepID=W8W0H5_9FLAO|nr:hypothetical protein [Nonlabens marinus]BAO56336.1 hypothetical protein NMS_2327 [Nonlabens marinus S1-08]